MVFPSLVIILAIAIFIRHFMEYEAVQYAFNGIRAAVLALIVLAVVRMWKNGIRDIFCFALFAVTLIVFVAFPISPVWPILACAFCGIVIKPVLDKRGNK
jgi:chromate transporter